MRSGSAVVAPDKIWATFSTPVPLSVGWPQT
jgi:hypothetical protein